MSNDHKGLSESERKREKRAADRSSMSRLNPRDKRQAVIEALKENPRNPDLRKGIRSVAGKPGSYTEKPGGRIRNSK